MSSQRVNLTTATPSQAGRISTIKLVSQSVTGPPGADGAGVSVALKEGGTTKVAVATVVDFQAGFDVDTAGLVTLDLAEYTGNDLPVAGGGTGASDAATARTNLGLGTAATAATGDFATAAQGATADAALAKASNLSDLTSASTARTNLGLGTAALISSTAGGDLSGTLPSPTVAKINGIAVTGTPAVGYVPTATSTSAATWQAAGGGGGFAIYGDGSGGTVTISGTTTLTRDMFYDVLTVQNGGVLKTANFRVFCKTSCTVDAGGIIQNNGTDGTVARWGGVAPTAGTLGAGANGADAAAGNSNGVAGYATTLSFGGASGAGGNAASTYTGGAAGSATAPGVTFGSARSLPTAINMKALSNGGTSTFAGGAGGGSGAAKTWNGGGGGSGAGVLVLVAKAITNNGTISANGGIGGQPNGGGSSDAGSGGGGGGGCVVLVYNTFTGSAATATGGAGGAALGTGNAGSAGSAGTIIALVNA